MTATSGFSAAASGVDASPFRNPAWEFLGGRLPVEDWTNAARRGRIEPVVRTGPAEAVREQIVRALHRDSQGHLLITGEKGVGKTAVVRQLTRRAAGGGRTKSVTGTEAAALDRAVRDTTGRVDGLPPLHRGSRIATGRSGRRNRAAATADSFAPSALANTLTHRQPLAFTTGC